MATSKTETKTTANDPDELVKIKLFKDSEKYKDDVFVAVNGRSFVIKRGVEVEVPRYIAEVLDHQQKMDNRVSDAVAAAMQ